MTSLLRHIWAVRVPKDATDVALWEGGFGLRSIKLGVTYATYFDSLRIPFKIELPPGNWSLIGVGINEEVAGKIVEKYDEHCVNCCYPDYTREDIFANQYILDTATDSLISLLKSKGLNTEDNYAFLKLND